MAATVVLLECARSKYPTTVIWLTTNTSSAAFSLHMHVWSTETRAGNFGRVSRATLALRYLSRLVIHSIQILLNRQAFGH